MSSSTVSQRSRKERLLRALQIIPELVIRRRDDRSYGRPCRSACSIASVGVRRRRPPRSRAVSRVPPRSTRGSREHRGDGLQAGRRDRRGERSTWTGRAMCRASAAGHSTSPAHRHGPSSAVRCRPLHRVSWGCQSLQRYRWDSPRSRRGRGEPTPRPWACQWCRLCRGSADPTRRLASPAIGRARGVRRTAGRRRAAPAPARHRCSRAGEPTAPFPGSVPHDPRSEAWNTSAVRIRVVQ